MYYFSKELLKKTHGSLKLFVGGITWKNDELTNISIENIIILLIINSTYHRWIVIFFSVNKIFYVVIWDPGCIFRMRAAKCQMLAWNSCYYSNAQCEAV